MQKIISIPTQEQCTRVLAKIERDNPEARWLDGDKPTNFNGWSRFGEMTCIRIFDGVIGCALKEYYQKKYPDTPITTAAEFLGEKYVVNTRTQEEFDWLMRAYEAMGWVWHSGHKPIEWGRWSVHKEETWSVHKEETCIDAKDRFIYCDKEYYEREEPDKKLITVQEFYNIFHPPVERYGVEEHEVVGMKYYFSDEQVARYTGADYGWEQYFPPISITGSITGILSRYQKTNQERKPIMQRLSLWAKRTLDAKTKKRIKAGFIDSNSLQLTSEGNDALRIASLAVKAIEDEFDKLADERIAEMDGEDSEK